MAHSPSAEKRIRQATKQRLHNASRRSMMRTYLKKMRQSLIKDDYSNAVEQYKQVQAILDRLAVQGLIHKNKAARHKSVFQVKLKALEVKTAAA